MMYIDKRFNMNSPTFSGLDTSSRLRNLEFEGQRRQIQYESFINIHHSTRHVTLIWSQKLFLPPHFGEKCVLENLRERIQFFIALNSQYNFDSKDTHMV